MFLDRLMPEVKRAIASGYYDIPAVRKKKISLVGVIARCKVPVIAEIKPVSPSAGRLLYGNAIETARVFVKAGACALSIITERSAFEGSIKTLAAAKREFDVPILMKDFVISEKQIDAAAKAADAVLLIEALLRRRRIDTQRFIEYAHAQGIEVLLEAHTAEEFRKAAETGADLLGINNRSLDTLSIDLRTTQRILAECKTEKPVVSESGIENASQVRSVMRSGADAVLVGTSILRSANAAEKIRELTSAC
jgi:indole-3-glycerol phosphate synthase